MLISSRDPFTCQDTTGLYELARELTKRGHAVTIFLVENGVFAARKSARFEALAETVLAGVKVVADGFSLRERAIPEGALLSGIARAELDQIMDALAAGAKTVWH
jgi:hypothetical protein